MAIQASYQSLLPFASESLPLLWERNCPQIPDSADCQMGGGTGGSLFLAEILSSLTGCLVETPRGPHRNVPCYPCCIFARQLGSSLTWDTCILWHSQVWRPQSNFTGHLMCQKMLGLVRLPDIGVIMSPRADRSVQQCHYLAQWHLPTLLEPVNPPRASGERRCMLEAHRKAVKSLKSFSAHPIWLLTKSFPWRSWIWAIGGECHCRQRVSYEIKIAKTRGEN